MSTIISQNKIESYRNQRWCYTPSLKLKNEKDALRFIDEVGFCLLFSCKEIPLPKLSGAALSRNWDWWSWKESLQAQKQWYNSRVVRHKATLLSMEMLPCFLALYYASGGCEVYEEAFYYQQLTRPAYDIADYLYQHGPTSVDDLRLHLAGKGKTGTRKFHTALQELQSKFMIAVSGVVERSWGVRVIDLFSHWVPPKVLAKAQEMTPTDARQQIIMQFIATSGYITQAEINRCFRWDNETTQLMIETLLDNQKIQPYQLKGTPDILLGRCPSTD